MAKDNKINIRKILQSSANDADEKTRLKKKILHYATQEKIYDDNTGVTQKGNEVSKKDNILCIADWNELNKKQKSIRCMTIIVACVVIALFSPLLKYSDNKMMTGILSSIIAISAGFLVACIVSHVMSKEDRKMAQEFEFSTTSMRALIEVLEQLNESAFKDFVPGTKLNEAQNTEPLDKVDKKI